MLCSLLAWGSDLYHVATIRSSGRKFVLIKSTVLFLFRILRLLQIVVNVLLSLLLFAGLFFPLIRAFILKHTFKIRALSDSFKKFTQVSARNAEAQHLRQAELSAQRLRRTSDLPSRRSHSSSAGISNTPMYYPEDDEHDIITATPQVPMHFFNYSSPPPCSRPTPSRQTALQTAPIMYPDWLQNCFRGQWRARFWIGDAFATWIIWLLDIMNMCFLEASQTWRSTSFKTQHTNFRTYLRHNPPSWPVDCFDRIFLQDTAENPCQILILCAVDRLSVGELRKHCSRHWLAKHPKLRSVIAVNRRTLVWVPIEISADLGVHDLQATPRNRFSSCQLPPPSPRSRQYSEELNNRLAPEDRVFKIANHVVEQHMDLTESTLYSWMSDIVSTQLRKDRPLWMIHLLQPVNTDLTVQPCKNGERVPADRISFIALQVHHAVADGVGLAHTFIQDFMDPFGAKLHGTTQIEARRFIPQFIGKYFLKPEDVRSQQQDPLLLDWMFAAAYNVMSLFKGFVVAMSFCFFWLFYNVRARNLVGGTRVRSKVTGRKVLAPPITLDLNELKTIGTQVEELTGMRPTVNDIFCFLVAQAVGSWRDFKGVGNNLSSDVLPTPLTVTRGPKPRAGTDSNYMPTARSQLSDSRSSSFGSLCAAPESTSPLECRKEDADDLRRLLDCARMRRYACDFDDHVAVLLPMSARLSLPTQLDNFTSMVLTRIPLQQAVEKQVRKQSGKVPSYAFLENFLDGNFRACFKSLWNRSRRENDCNDPAPAVITLLHLLAVKQELDEIKRSNIRSKMFALLNACLAVFPDAIMRVFINTISNKAQVLLTNVPGPTLRGTICGKRLLSLQAWPPIRGEVSTAAQLLSSGRDVQLLLSIDACEFEEIDPEEGVAAFNRTIWDAYTNLRDETNKLHRATFRI